MVTRPIKFYFNVKSNRSLESKDLEKVFLLFDMKSKTIPRMKLIIRGKLALHGKNKGKNKII